MFRLFFNIIYLVVYKLIPIKKGRLVFMSYHGKYTDSPRYLSEYISSHYPNYEVIWLIDSKHKKEVPANMRARLLGSIGGFMALASANIIVDNVYCNKSFTWYNNDKYGSFLYKYHSVMMNKRKQVAYTTFHGVPLKKMGRDRNNNLVKAFSCPNTVMLLDNQHSIRVFDKLTFGKVSIRKCGSPRIEYLLKQSQCDSSEIKKQMGVPIGYNVLMYAPTFRNEGKSSEGEDIYRSGLEQLESFDLEQLFEAMKRKFGGDWVMILRFHQKVASMVDWNLLNDKYSGLIINGNKYDEMNDYLSVTDLLITDYSSCMFDFSTLKRPCFLYINDYDNYRDKERGLYFGIEELPFPSASRFDDLISLIQSFDETIYMDRLSSFHKALDYVIDYNASENIAKTIIGEGN